MKRLGLLLAFLGALAGVMLLLAPHVAASTTCHATGNWCQGDAYASVNGATATRYFHFTTAAADPGASPINQGTWEVDAGAAITLKYFGGTAAVGGVTKPTAVTLIVYYETGTGTLVQTVYNGAGPANGGSLSFTFYGTSNGLVGGSPRAGTLRLYVHAVLTGTTGGLTDYNVDSDGFCTVGSVAQTCGPRDAGALRTNMLIQSIAHSAYPADSTFAYGTAGDESATITGTFTQAYGDANLETMRTTIVDLATFTVGLTGSTVDVDTNSLAQAYVIDSSLPQSSSPYIGGLTSRGTSALTSLSFSMFAGSGHGANIVLISGNLDAYDSTSFNIDPRIAMDSDGVGTFAAADGTAVAKVTNCSGTIATLYNKGETVCTATYILNARGEQLTRAMTFAREDASNTVCQSIGSVTPSAGVYSTTSTLNTGATCTTAADTTGSTRHYRVTNTDQLLVSGTIFSVSSLLRFDQDGSGTPDNLVHECLNACAGADITVFNRGETVDYEGFLINARGTQYTAGTVTWVAMDSLGATTNSQSLTPSSGKYSGAAFTLSSSEKATADTTGDPHKFQATKDGNTANTASPDFGVSSLLFVDSHIQLSTTLNKDDFPTENANEVTAYIISNAQTDTTRGWCHVKGVRKDVEVDTTGSAVAWSYIDPLTATRFSGTTDTGSDGWTPTHLDLLASTPLGTWNFRCTVTFSGDSGTNDQPFTVSVPEGTGGGFPGDPTRVFTAPESPAQGGIILLSISESLLDGTARTGNAASTLIYIYDPSNALVVNGVTPTEVQFGVYRYAYTAAADAPIGNWLVIVKTTDVATGNPIGTSNAFNIQSATMDITFSGSITNPGLYWWIELAFWGVVFWYCFRYRNLFTLVFAIGGCLHLVNPTWLFGLDKSIPWMALGMFLDFVVRYLGRKNPEKVS